jgi:hypothetical protein
MGYKHLIGRVPAYKISKKSIFVGRFCFQVFFQELENLTRRTFRALIPPEKSKAGSQTLQYPIYPAEYTPTPTDKTLKNPFYVGRYVFTRNEYSKN